MRTHRYKSTKLRKKWLGYIEPNDRRWIIYVNPDGSLGPLFDRDPKTGAVLGKPRSFSRR